MRKFFITLALLIGVGVVVTYGPVIPLNQWVGVALILAVIAGFVCLFVMFHRWHRRFHARMVRDGINWRNSR